MHLPSSDTPLYNHPLPAIESWLQNQGCKQDKNNVSSWYVRRNGWEAEISMDIEEIRVRYINAIAGNKDIQRVFPYSLSRRDIEDAIFTGP
ncbi:MAG: DUF3143 domain-containing protein [Pseudanabaena sp. RU_4_16]|nr:DUF3143 domain-containing protein [Pseudanabaena sp. RU_4_16]NKB18141.1 DUF3143 domain-containing protein [Pseudanabaena sp. CRU_2_10]